MEPIILIQNPKNYDISIDNRINKPDEDLLLKENEISMTINIASKQTELQ
ncbi:12850_t:CDS:2 [Funneliformis mosseae]|uniref:12850_t:CDS:1 n=1 Tax=Funneliformis mosseae TaxID=27381 RepID=A0A9N8W9W3_FUNMO|nr:12850_t:CDS:2 [Funneliformis mosseae]